MVHTTQEVLIVEVAGQSIGLLGSMVRELLRAVFITPLPNGGRFVEGVVNIRGEIVPVLDVRQWLGLPARPVEPADHLVVVWAGSALAALRVDRAVELTRLDVGASGEGRGASEVPGARRFAGASVVQHAGGLVVIPNLADLLSQASSLLAG